MPKPALTKPFSMPKPALTKPFSMPKPALTKPFSMPKPALTKPFFNLNIGSYSKYRDYFIVSPKDNCIP